MSVEMDIVASSLRVSHIELAVFLFLWDSSLFVLNALLFNGVFTFCVGYANSTSDIIGWVQPSLLPCLNLQAWNITGRTGTLFEVTNPRVPAAPGNKSFLCYSDSQNDIDVRFTPFVKEVLSFKLNAVLVAQTFAQVSDVTSNCVFQVEGTQVSVAGSTAMHVLQAPTYASIVAFDGGLCWAWQEVTGFQSCYLGPVSEIAGTVESAAAYFFDPAKQFRDPNFLLYTSSEIESQNVWGFPHLQASALQRSANASLQLTAVFFESAAVTQPAQELCDDALFFGPTAALYDSYANGCRMVDAINAAFNQSAFGTNVYVPQLTFAQLDQFISTLISTYGQLQNAVVDATVLDAEIASVQSQLQTATSVLRAYAQQINGNRAQILKLYAKSGPLFQQSLSALQLKLNAAISTLALSDAFSIFRIITSVLSIISGVAEDKAGQVFGALGSIGASLSSITTTTDKQALEVKTLKKAVASTERLMLLIFNLTNLPVTDDANNLPKDVAAFADGETILGEVKNYMGALNNYLSQGYSVGEAQLFAQILGLEAATLDLTNSWLQQAQAVQRLQAQLATLTLSASVYSTQISGTLNASFLGAETAALQSQLYEWLTWEVSALYFVTLSRPDARAYVSTAKDLSSVGLSGLQLALRENFTLYEENFNQNPRVYGTARYRLVGYDYSVLSNGDSLSFYVGWPTNADGSPNVSYYDTRVVQADVVFNFASGCNIVNAQSRLYKFGQSYMLTQDGRALSFAHDPLQWVSTMGCNGDASACFISHSVSTESNYVQFSPYGLWNLSVSTAGFDASQVTSIDIFFKVHAVQNPNYTFQTYLFNATTNVGVFCETNAPCDYPYPSTPPDCNTLAASMLSVCSVSNAGQQCAPGLCCKRHTHAATCGGNVTTEQYYCVQC